MFSVKNINRKPVFGGISTISQNCIIFTNNYWKIAQKMVLFPTFMNKVSMISRDLEKPEGKTKDRENK
jgi:hypothetical protein